MRAGFLNVDLEIESRASLAELVSALEPEAFAIHQHPAERGYFACLELSSDRPDADSTIRGFIDLVDRLSPPLREIWDRALRRTFDVGLQGGLQPNSTQHVLEAETIRAIADLGANVAITIYPPQISDEPDVGAL